VVLLNTVLGLVMFGVALDLTLADFRRILHTPRPFVVGFLAQYLLFPALTFVVILAMAPPPSLALGVLLVAACPGGNMSNFLTHLARGNTPLAVSMTALSTAAAPLLTPIVFRLWGGLVPGAEGLLRDVIIPPGKMVGTLLLILGAPLAAGMVLAHRWPNVARRLAPGFRRFSLVGLGLFIVGALVANGRALLAVVPIVGGLIFVQNALAMSGGYLAGWLTGLPERDRRAIGIEIAIRNSAVGLGLVLTFFGGLGGMAVAAGWYGLWDLLSGYALASWWSRRPPPLPG
jgi:BASS family bile acid:Na+ symporter